MSDRWWYTTNGLYEKHSKIKWIIRSRNYLENLIYNLRDCPLSWVKHWEVREVQWKLQTMEVWVPRLSGKGKTFEIVLQEVKICSTAFAIAPRRLSRMAYLWKWWHDHSFIKWENKAVFEQRPKGKEWFYVRSETQTPGSLWYSLISRSKLNYFNLMMPRGKKLGKWMNSKRDVGPRT